VSYSFLSPLARSERCKIRSSIKMVAKSAPSEGHSRWIAAALAKRSGSSPDAKHTADATITVWEDFATALTPIIGRQGVSALYNRSVALTAQIHPWLASCRASEDHSVDLHAFQSVIALQSDENAAAGTDALLQTFYDVLVSLIGSPLCEQLLTSVRDGSGSHRSRGP